MGRRSCWPATRTNSSVGGNAGWIHLRTSNPIESTFAPVRARSNLTKGPGSRAAALGMVFKLVQEAERRWRRVNAPELVALVATGARFVNGKLVEESLERNAA